MGFRPWAGLGCAAAAAVWLAPPAAAGERPAVAVFDIKDRKAGLAGESLQKLGDYLAARLAASGAFMVVPRDDLKQQLSKKKLESYDESFDRRVQIELGAELAAQKTVATQLMPMGRECVVSSTLFDLRQAVSEAAGIAAGACDEAGVRRSLDSVAAQLAGRGGLDGDWRMSAELSRARQLMVRLWTDRGPSGVYLEGDQVFVFLQANRDCWVRLVYQQVDGSQIQIFPNSLYNDYRIKGGQVWPVPGVNDDFEFEVGPPFGQERITAYASTEPFPAPAGVASDTGLLLLDEAAAKRGILVKKAKVQTATATASITTAPRKR